MTALIRIIHRLFQPTKEELLLRNSNTKRSSYCKPNK